MSNGIASSVCCEAGSSVLVWIRAAEAALGALLEQQEQLLGPDDHEILETVDLLGMMFLHEGDDARARTHFQRALEGSTRMLGAEHELTNAYRESLQDSIGGIDGKLK